MTAYALAHLRRPETFHPEIFEYMEKVQATLKPFGGRFLVHGGTVVVKEGDWPGDLVMIEFPDLDAAERWYASAEYQAIVRLRSDHLDGEAILVEGVGPDHDAAAFAARFRAAVGA